MIHKIEENTKAYYREMYKILNPNCDVPDDEFIIMDFPKASMDGLTSNFYVCLGSDAVKSYTDIFHTETWIESKDSKKNEKYLVTDCQDRGIAYLAMQKCLFKEFKVYLKTESSYCSKVSTEEINDNRRQLLEKGFYSDSLLLASDLFFSQFKNEIGQVNEKYRMFVGKKGIYIDENRLQMFLRQFLIDEMSQDECEQLLDGILRILDHGIFIGRKAIVENMGRMISRLNDGEIEIRLCPLGNEMDSANHYVYYLNDILSESGNENIKTYGTLQEALADNDREYKIVLFDDGAYSGKQVSSIFQEYMGIDADARETKEHHVDPLNEKEKENLKKHEISLAFICFNSEQRDSITEMADSIGIRVDNIDYVEDLKSKLFDSARGIFVDDCQRKVVEDKLREIGTELLTSVKKKWEPGRVESSALGYNDSQQMVVLESSVPTYTIPAFWIEGTYHGEPWMPLFVRTDKRD